MIFANEKSGMMPDNDVLLKGNILLITGPEGGFTKDEIDFLESLPNSHSISLGSNILRAETAMASLISFVNFSRMSLSFLCR